MVDKIDFDEIMTYSSSEEDEGGGGQPTVSRGRGRPKTRVTRGGSRGGGRGSKSRSGRKTLDQVAERVVTVRRWEWRPNGGVLEEKKMRKNRPLKESFKYSPERSII